MTTSSGVGIAAEGIREQNQMAIEIHRLHPKTKRATNLRRKGKSPSLSIVPRRKKRRKESDTLTNSSFAKHGTNMICIVQLP
mmetsp:Transcript_9544/g.10879  ORF Transcript_9544/g.10879 Transcript_9544/m.10879 type:complete len:82 (-) Transcript_9544:955-1200(-)